jgi:hypothetical protein
MTKQNSEQEIIGFLLGESALDGRWFSEAAEEERGNFWWRKYLRKAIEARPNQPDKGKEIDELRAHIERLREALIETHKQLNIERGMKVEQAQIHAEVLCPKINPAQSLQAYHDSIVEKCASVADEYGHTDNVIARDIRELKEQK